MNNFRIRALGPGMALLAASQLVAQQTFAGPVHSGYVEAGMEYRSNPVVDELDVTANQSDTAALFQAGISTDWRATGRWSLYAGYDLDTRRHTTLDQFDLTLHLAQLGTRYDFSFATLGVEQLVARASLADEPFLSQQQTTLYAEWLLGTRGLIRTGLTGGRHRYPAMSERNAAIRGVRTDLYWAATDKSMVLAGFDFDRVDSEAEEHRYTASTLELRYQYGFNAFGRLHDAGIGWRYQRRDYREALPTADSIVENRRLLQAKLDLGLTDRIDLNVVAERGDVSSARPGVDYSDERLSLSLKASF